MGLLVKTPWQLETSEEFNTTISVITGGEGKLHLQHESTGAKLVVRYTFIGGGVSKGAFLNIAESLKSDPSGGFSNVKVARAAHVFGPADFPCWGWMAVGGATAGIFQPSFMSQSGGAVGVALFGFIPFGGIAFWGRFNSIMPSVGPSLLMCKYAI